MNNLQWFMTIVISLWVITGTGCLYRASGTVTKPKEPTYRVKFYWGEQYPGVPGLCYVPQMKVWWGWSTLSNRRCTSVRDAEAIILDYIDRLKKVKELPRKYEYDHEGDPL